MINRIVLVGIVSDPPNRGVTDKGKTWVRLRVKTWDCFDGAQYDAYHNVSLFNKDANVKEGDTVVVEGKMKYRKVEKDGVNVWQSEVSASTVQVVSASSRDAVIDEIPF